MKTIYLAGGCFWGTQKFFDQFDGVVETEVGYANGATENPDYQAVCRGSGHAETVRIVFDEARISLDELLDDFFLAVDPLAVNKQGPDVGVQYRSGVYYVEAEQLPALQARFAREEAKYGQKLATELLPLQNFTCAEEYHQKYLDKNPTGYCHLSKHLLNLNKEREQHA